jgi:hypothetical protein
MYQYFRIFMGAWGHPYHIEIYEQIWQIDSRLRKAGIDATGALHQKTSEASIKARDKKNRPSSGKKLQFILEP